MKKYKIVCVDDELQVLQIYSEFLSDSDYEIINFDSCDKAISFIAKNHKNIVYIFSDFQMGEMTGFDFRKKINDLGVEIPFSLVTGFYDLEMSKNAMALGISSFLEKPFTENDLKNLIAGQGEKRKLFLEEEREMIISFIEESYPMLLEIENLIMSLETDPTNTKVLNTYFRLLHTIKGTASCVGLVNIPKFAHSYEDLVVKLQKQQVSLSPVVATVLLKALDFLKLMYEETKKGNFEIEITIALEMFNINFLAHSKVESTNEDKVVSPSLVSVENIEKADEKIGVSVSVLNNFMELSGQLTVIRNTLIKSAIILGQRYHGDNELDIMIESLDEMHKVSSILQNDISEMRKIGLDVVYKPLRRVIRDSSKSLKKNISFHVEGEGLRVDTVIGKALSNSLVHMIRNSIDHGIELPEKRVLAGKNEVGNIFLKSYLENENVIVELSDDGNGLSLSRIKQKAIDKNMYSEDQLKLMPDQKIFSLIFDSGFSTAQQVSDISGRGVGMDMVKNSIESIGGKIVIESQEGFGTKFIMTLPIPRSVLIIKSLMIESSNSIFSIPLDEVSEVLRIEDYQESKIFHKIENSIMISHHDELIPLLEFNQILNGKSVYEKTNILNVVIVLVDGFKYGIVVDEILDIEEIVVKKMSKHFSKADVFMGVTFLGHGALALILDTFAIAEKYKIKISSDLIDRIKSSGPIIEIVEEFMQFNLKHSINYAIPLQVVSRLEEILSNRIEFVGSVPIVRYRGNVMPLLFIERQLKLCAVESSLSDFYPEILNIIVINMHNKQFGIVVDEILDIGLTSDQLNTLIIEREGFLGTIFIGNDTVSIIDVNYLIDTYVEFEKKANEENASLSQDSDWITEKAA